MHLPEFVLLLIATVAAIAAGLAMVASNYRVARVLFWIAALSFGSLGLVWSQQSHGYSLATQMIVAAVCAGIAAATLVWGLDEIRGRANAAEIPSVTDKPEPYKPAQGKNSPNISAGGNVTIGHIGDVTINQANQPELKLLEQTESVDADGRHLTVFTIEIVSQVTTSFLAIEILAEGLLSAHIMPPPVGGVSSMMLRNKRVAPNAFYAELTSPRGKYFVTVITKERTPVRLGYQF
jgi:hypothetical protein